MLKQLLIKNYALINELSITPSSNLNIITGETGAGKSIMLGAVGLLLGNRADSKALLNEDVKCIIEGQFDISNYNLQNLFKKEDLDFEAVSIIRREIAPSGKSRAFINDSPVTLDVLKKLGIKLMDVHSQHETLQLGKNTFQLKFIDVYANTLSLRNTYFNLFSKYKQEQKHLIALKEESEAASKESDYNTFLLEELTEANLKTDEQKPLEDTVQMMEHAEEIKTKLNECLLILNGEEQSTNMGILQVRQALSQLSKISDTYENIANRMESVLIEVNDLTSEIEKKEGEIHFDPNEAELAQERLSMIYKLQQKHGVSDITSLIDIQNELEEKASRTFNLDEEISKSEKLVSALLTECNQKAEELSTKRQLRFKELALELTDHLKNVGINDATIEINRKEIPLENSGNDEISILFSANKGIKPQELAKVASGGEFSRFMFCIKYILATKVALPTIIFDEIDTGVSGEIAIKLGDMMKKMAKNHQVITISHLPQIAAKGDQHYFVYKDNSAEKTMSKIKELDAEDRVEEIAKMIGGDNPSAIAFENARELLKS